MPRLNFNNWNSYSNRYSTSTYNNEREFFNTYHLQHQSPYQVEIDVYLTGRQNSLLESCMQLSQGPQDGYRELLLGNLIYDFEEEGLDELKYYSKDPSNLLRATLQAIADDSRIPLKLEELNALLAKPLEFTGDAKGQTQRVVSRIDVITSAHAAAAQYRPGQIR